MLKNRTKRRALNAEINVVPYIDVMLVLLVIFMITAPMLSQGVEVELPKAHSSEVIDSTHREPIIVSINRRGEYFLNLNSNPDAVIEPRALMLRVAAELELAKRTHESIPVLVKGDTGVDYGKVVMAMSLLKNAGAKQVGLLTDSQDETKEHNA